MSSRWGSRLGEGVALVPLIAALVSLQVSLQGARLVYELPAFGLVAIAVLVACATGRLTGRIDRPCFWATAAFCVYLLARALTSPSPYAARADLYSLLAATAIYGVTATVLSRARSRMVVLVALLAFSLCHVLVCLIQFGIGHNFIFISVLENVEATGRPSGLYGGPGHLAGLLEVLGIFGLSTACWSRWPKWSRVLIGYLTLACYIGLAFTGSRGGYLGAVASILAFAVLSLIALRSGGQLLFWKWGAVGVVGLTAVVWIGNSLLKQSASLTGRVEQVAAIDEGRLYLWQAAIDQWKLQPWIGTGSGTYRFYGRQFRAEEMQQDPVAVHNDYLHLLSEYGLIGVVGLLVFLAVHLRSGWRNYFYLGPQRLAAGSLPLGDRLALTIGALGAITAYVIHSFVDFNMHIPANALLLAFAFGILANRGPSASAEGEAVPISQIPRILVAVVAAVLLLQCLRLLPGEYYANRARVALEGEDPATAVAMANEALRYEQANPKILFYLGRALSAIGDEEARATERTAHYEAALGAFDRARMLNPLDGSHPLDMALLYDRMGRFAEAEWMFGLARARDPRSVSLADYYRSHLHAWRKDGS